MDWKKKNVVVEKCKTCQFFLVFVNGRIARNPRSSPMGAMTFATEEEAKEWCEKNLKGA